MWTSGRGPRRGPRAPLVSVSPPVVLSVPMRVLRVDRFFYERFEIMVQVQTGRVRGAARACRRRAIAYQRRRGRASPSPAGPIPDPCTCWHRSGAAGLPLQRLRNTNTGMALWVRDPYKLIQSLTHVGAAMAVCGESHHVLNANKRAPVTRLAGYSGGQNVPSICGNKWRKAQRRCSTHPHINAQKKVRPFEPRQFPPVQSAPKASP